MTPIATEATNAVLQGEGCTDLPIVRDAEAETQTSYRLPDADDLARLIAGKPVALMIHGRLHPPVWLSVPE